VDAAVARAGEVQPAWAAEGYDIRAGVLRAAAASLQERSAAFVEQIVRETGAIGGKAEYEVNAAVNELYEAAALTSRASAEILPSHSTSRLSMAMRVPVGVVGCMTPWNFPLVLGMRVIAPALALGNAVVLKPSPETPIVGGLMLAELFESAGLPAGTFSVVPGGIEVGKQIVAHPGVHMIHFTGSSPVGREIAIACAEQFKKVSLELGGNNALVVLEDADLDQAAMIGAWSSFHYQGQTCITAGRHLVVRDIYDRYVEALAERARNITVGDPATGQVGLGPMINERQRDRGHAMLQEAIEQGARVVEGGTYDGLFYRPTVVVDVPEDSRLWQEEIFAPIAPVRAVESEEEALRETNSTPYGLVNAVLTGDSERGMRFAERIRSGMAHVNDSTCLDEAHVPFGGMGWSGYGGRSGGESNLEEFTERRWISVQRAPSQYPY
jgi:benzaldehyde dehydrogenase (NAD)